MAGLVGAGRTELMQAIFGAYPGVSEATVVLDGKPLKIRAPVDAIRAGIGMVPEDRKRHGIVPGLSVGHNITLAVLQRFAKGGRIDSAAELDTIHTEMKRLSVRAAHPMLSIASLSGGNQQKAVLTRMLLTDPKVLILDEPTRGVDVGAKYRNLQTDFPAGTARHVDRDGVVRIARSTWHQRSRAGDRRRRVARRFRQRRPDAGGHSQRRDPPCPAIPEPNRSECRMTPDVTTQRADAKAPRGAFGGSQRIQQLFSRYKILALLIAVAVIWIFFSVLTHGAFVTPRNLSNLLRQMSITGMLACGMVFVIIAGEIDLSVGSLLGLLGGVAAILDVNRHWPIGVTVPVVMLLGVLVGMFNGWWSTYRRVPSFIVGLGGMLAYRGILLGVTGGSTIAPVSDDFVFVGQGYLPRLAGDSLAVVLFFLLAFLTVRQRQNRERYQLRVVPIWQDVAKVVGAGAILAGFVATLDRYGGIPVPVLLLLALLGIFTWIATQTVFGRRIYAVGSNLEATRLSGVNTNRVKLAIFALMGLMCAFAGIVNTARLAAGSPSAGSMGELDAIAACFIGGTSMRGGSGTVYGALIGALVMASLDNGMSMLDVDAYWQMIVKGGILVLAVWIDVVSGSNRR